VKLSQKLTLGTLLALLAAAAVGLYLTSAPAPSTAPRKATPGLNAGVLSLNQRYLATARRLASTATTLDERNAAKAALKDADHELDLQYAYALQRASLEPVPQTPEIRSIRERITRIKTAIGTRTTEVSQIKAAAERVRGMRHATLEDQLDVAQAELSLLQEMLADAKDDLIQAGGDQQARLQKLKTQDATASHAADTYRFPPLQSMAPSPSFLAKCSIWRSFHRNSLQIQQAQKEASAAAAALSLPRNSLQKQLAGEQEQRSALEKRELTPEQIASLIAVIRHPSARESSRQATPSAKPSPNSSGTSSGTSASDLAIMLIRRISTERIMLRILDNRIGAMNVLASAYLKWSAVVSSTERSVLHAILVDGLWLVLLVTFAFFLSRLTERLFAGLSLERKQKTTLQAMLRISVRLVIVIVILMVIFGEPSHLSTVLGLAGAGLAVALQDFVLSFCGWFVLMGRHGIHVGDWIEINPNSFTGVRGEVVEITLFRTVLLETGNWTEPGHPTGRQVAFMNMYAVSGYYFNFSTAGQWLWDELEVAIPRSQNPYPLVEQVRALVAKETQPRAHLAEREWQHVSRRYGTKLFSAQPTVNVKHTDSGVVAIIRYMTRVDERTAARHRLNDDILKLFHNGERIVPETEDLRHEPAPASDRS
jgi:small-conductance mechanosensitive channel